MRYLDAYEIAQAGLEGKTGAFPVTEKLLSTYFDNAVMDVGKRVVRDVGIYSYNRWKNEPETRIDDDNSVVNPFKIGYKHTRGFLLNTAMTYNREDGQVHIANGHDEIYGNAVFKVEKDGKGVPFIDNKRIVTTNTDSSAEDYELGWWLWHDVRSYRITTVTADTPNSNCTQLGTILPSYGLGVDPLSSELACFERIQLSGITGGDAEMRRKLNTGTTFIRGIVEPSLNTVHINLSLDSGDDSFDVFPTGAGPSLKTDNYWIMFNQVPEVSDDIKIWFNKLPLVKGDHHSAIDLPESLAHACIYHAMSHILNLVGNLQVASGYRGIAKKMEMEYTDTHAKNQPMPDILPNPLTDFNYTS